jgi:HEAT repeat protein
LGPKSRQTIPELIYLLKQDDDELVRTFAVQALGFIGNPNDKAVIEALSGVAPDMHEQSIKFAFAF